MLSGSAAEGTVQMHIGRDIRNRLHKNQPSSSEIHTNCENRQPSFFGE